MVFRFLLSSFLLLICYHTRTVECFLPLPSTQAHQQQHSNLLLHNHQAEINEFSRIIQPERVIRRRTSGSYSISITAEPNERIALANRFQLSAIDQLTADVTLEAEYNTPAKGGMEVKGTCGATVTQRCVRTNEEFSATMEFPLYCIVRPVASVLMQQQQEETDNVDKDNTSKRSTTKVSHNNNKMEEMDLLQLQNMLQDDLNEDDLMEDEMIYSTDGKLDVGELVAQLFWLKLDPYPKKPGTQPVRTSISG